MNNNQLAIETGKTLKYIQYILNRKRRPSPDVAKALERATGIDRCAWLWPNEYPNPMLTPKPQEPSDATPEKH